MKACPQFRREVNIRTLPYVKEFPRIFRSQRMWGGIENERKREKELKN